MERIGWEIRPAGRVLLFILAGLITYFTLRWLQRLGIEINKKSN